MRLLIGHHGAGWRLARSQCTWRLSAWKTTSLPNSSYSPALRTSCANHKGCTNRFIPIGPGESRAARYLLVFSSSSKIFM